MKKLRLILLAVVVLAGIIWFVSSRTEEKDADVEQLLQTDQQRSDSMKRALGIE